MKILIDLGHPAHIHYFRNTIQILSKKGVEFCVFARDKEVLQELLDEYNIKYHNRGKGKKSLIGKFLYTFYADILIFFRALIFKPDLFLSFSSPYAAHASFLYKKPHIALDDTEHATLERMMYLPFTKTIINPSFYKKKISSKQVFMNSHFELFYLHPNYFTPNENVLEMYNLENEKNIFIIRLVAWNASHDIGHNGMSNDDKMKLAKVLSEHGKVIISSEEKLPKELEGYVLKINPSHFHDILYYSSLYIGEGSTTASECSMLGTTNILINSLELSNIEEQEKVYELSYHLKTNDSDQLFKLIDDLIASDFNKEKNIASRKRLLQDKIDPTEYLVDFLLKQ